MSDSAFIFTQNQTDTLTDCRRYLEDPNLQNWYQEQLEEAQTIQELFRDSGFPNNDLTEDQIDEIFRWMKKICNNRALARNLYEVNGLDRFNQGLRELLFGESSLVERMDQFLDLVGVGKATLSHFLYVFKPNEFPVATPQMSSVLDIQSNQRREAERISLSNQGISDTSDLHNRTIQYLGDIVIYGEVLGVPDYFLVNDVLWYEYERITEGIDPEIPLSSVSIEADLRSYLANNPHILGTGFTVVGEEYDTREIGRMDILLKDSQGTHIVVETKKGKSSDKVVGQILRYMGWVQRNLSDNVKGIIILAEPDQRLDYALVPLSNTRVMFYKVRFDLSDTFNN